LTAAEDVEVVELPGEAAKYDAPDVGDGIREEPGVLTGVLSVLEKMSAGGTHPEGLPGWLVE
jgi:hypothetical protein